MDAKIDVRKRLTELAEKAYRENRYVFTDFLNVSQLSQYFELVKKKKGASSSRENEGYDGEAGRECDLAVDGEIEGVDVRAFGGTAGCERCMVRFGSPEMFGYDEPYPITLLKLYPAMAKFAEALTHRDYLGSLVGLGIEREKIGDIIIPRSRTDGNSIEKHTVYAFVTEEISDYIIDNLSYVKHTHIRIERCEEVPDEVAPQFEELSVIVSSNRLDAIVAKLYNLSREQALKLFVEGKVFLNGINMTGNARSLKEGEVVSVRGYGKFIFNGEGGNTKKDKLYIKVSKYV